MSLPVAAAPPPAKRPRNAAATRDAILRAATVAFTRAGYDGVGVREIAAEAGVTAMLVNRYFGSKEALFAAAADAAFATGTLPLDQAGTLSRTVAHLLVACREPDAVDPVLLTLRSAHDPRAATMLRDCLVRHVEGPLAAQLAGPDPQARAALIVALVAGFQFVRTVLGSTALAGETDGLRDRLASVLKGLAEPAGRATAR